MVSSVEQALLAGMIFVIMLGMGASLTWRDFALAFKRPRAMLVGLFAQFGFLPLIAFLLAITLPVPPEVKLGLLIMGCMPGGTTSNMFTYFARADLALSVLMTVNSTLVGVFAIPVLLVFYLTAMQSVGVDLRLPAENIVLTIILLLLPVFLGMGLRKLNANWGALAEIFGAALGVVFILALIVSWVPRNWTFLMATHWSVFAGAIALGLFGFLAGYVFSAAIGMTRTAARTIALEIGIQNGPLAIAIVALTFTGPLANLQQGVMAVPALYSLFIVISASLLTLYYRARPVTA